MLVLVATEVFHMKQGWGPMVLRLAPNEIKFGSKSKRKIVVYLEVVWFP